MFLNFIKSNKSQISIYIIVGIVLILLAGTSVYIYTNTLTKETETLTKETFEETIPAELLPFKRYVEQCSHEVLDQAVRMAGTKGGIIYPEELDMEIDEKNPTESDVLTVFPESDFHIPYWYYIRGENNCRGGCQEIQPSIALEGEPIGTIQSQVEMFIERNIGECLKDKYKLEPIGIYYEEKGKPRAEVKFTKEDTQLFLEYPFELEKEKETSEVNRFTAKVDIPFRDYYNNALFISGIAYHSNFLEKGTLNWISTQSGMDSSMLPPKDGSSSDTMSFMYWTLPEVKNKLQKTLTHNIPLFTFNKSRNFHPVSRVHNTSYYPIKKNFYDQFILPGNESFSKYNIDFTYNEDWNPFLMLNDDDFILKPEHLSIDWFPWFGVTKMRTMYSLSYPVMISLSNPDDDFNFNFAVEVNIRDNKIMKTDYEPFDYTIFDDYTGGETFFCDPGMRTSKNVSFTIKDGKTEEPVDDVAMTYICGNEECQIGKTDETGEFNGPLPVCSNGKMQFMKSDYEKIFYKMSSSIDYPNPIGDIYLEPYRIINATMKNIVISKIGHGKNGDWEFVTTSGLSHNAEVSIMLERIPEDDPNIIRDEYTFIESFNNSRPKEIKILPGKYKGDIFGVVNKRVTIPPDRRCVKKKGKKKCYYVPKEEIIMEQYSGIGAEFSKERGTMIEISKDNLDYSNKIIFKQIYVDLPSVIKSNRFVEDLDEMGKIGEYSTLYRNGLKPKFE